MKSSTYTVNIPPVVNVTFSPAGGTFTEDKYVTLATTTLGATIRYTEDGSMPTEITGFIYYYPLFVSNSSTIKAIAFKSGAPSSIVTSATFTINSTPLAQVTFSVPSGTYSTSQMVSLATTAIGATIRYTIDGTTPTENEWNCLFCPNICRLYNSH